MIIKEIIIEIIISLYCHINIIKKKERRNSWNVYDVINSIICFKSAVICIIMYYCFITLLHYITFVIYISYIIIYKSSIPCQPCFRSWIGSI